MPSKTVADGQSGCSSSCAGEALDLVGVEVSEGVVCAGARAGVALSTSLGAAGLRVAVGVRRLESPTGVERPEAFAEID